MVQAVLAIEDRRYYDHPGVDPIGIAGARRLRNLVGGSAYSAGASTITQQLVRNVFLPQFDGMDAAERARERLAAGASCSSSSWRSCSTRARRRTRSSRCT